MREIRDGFNATAAPNNAQGTAPDHSLDNFYLSFENRFRGKRSEIKSRLEVYLPILRDACAGGAERPVLDLGCGRGEWLELLKEAGMHAAGVDLNTAMVAQCQQRELSATESDALEYLRKIPNESFGAVTGFHIIEHLPLEVLINLIAEARRVLKAGGLAIFESPNCKNLIVGACNFNVDPTHRNPVFPETARFILETQGFADVRLEYLTPAEGSPFNGTDETSAALRELLYGAQDFAVIGRRAAG
jgi:O-antigen chain-terminating methyltransferase